MHHVFGIRHHGPGSARSVLSALQQLQPDCVLVEGPPDADALIPQLAHPDVEAPIALLINTPIQKEQRAKAVFYPFAEFSPEWQALHYALQQQIHVAFMDLSCQHRFAVEQQQLEALQAHDALDLTPIEPPSLSPEQQLWQHYRHDPIALLAEQAGYQDSERFWEHLVEQQPHAGEMFQSIHHAMGALRDYLSPMAEDDSSQQMEQYREASMRKIIRQAEKQGFQRIAVICGAWHAPALVDLKSTAKTDNQLLKGLAKSKVDCAWIAWTHGRLMRRSGYGAGVEAVGWYAHLWKYYQNLEQEIDSQRISIDWLSQFAHALRHAGFDASSAQLIDATQLIQALLHLRGRRIPDLDDLFDVIRSVLHHGQDLPEPVLDQLLRAEKLGKLPESYIELPIQQDFLQQCKSLRLKLDAAHRELELDLRQAFDLRKSQFFHRLALLGLNWAQSSYTSNSRGSYKEAWRLSWQPENSLYLNEMSLWGYTIADACRQYLADQLQHSQQLSEVAQAIEKILLAGLDPLLDLALQRLQSLASTHQDPNVLLETLNPLVNALRYGSVRAFNVAGLAQIIEQLAVRMMLALPQYCLSINEDLAQTTAQSLLQLHQILQRLEQPELLHMWQQLIERLLTQSHMNGYLHGYVTRLAKQQMLVDDTSVERYLSHALSNGQNIEYSASWFEGFIHQQALLLLHDDSLWQLVNQWLVQLPEHAFIEILPILRRSTSDFDANESRKLAEKAHHASVAPNAQSMPEHDFNIELGLSLLQQLEPWLHPPQGDSHVAS